MHGEKKLGGKGKTPLRGSPRSWRGFTLPRGFHGLSLLGRGPSGSIGWHSQLIARPGCCDRGKCHFPPITQHPWASPGLPAGAPSHQLTPGGCPAVGNFIFLRSRTSRWIPHPLYASLPSNIPSHRAPPPITHLPPINGLPPIVRLPPIMRVRSRASQAPSHQLFPVGCPSVETLAPLRRTPEYKWGGWRGK